MTYFKPFLGLEGDDGFVVLDGDVQPELGDLVHEVVLVGDGEFESELREVFGNLHHAVPPVVCALGVLGVVDVVEGDDDAAHVHFPGVVHGPVSDQAVVVVLDPGNDGLGLHLAVVFQSGVFKLTLQMLGPLQVDSGGHGFADGLEIGELNRFAHFVGHLGEDVQVFQVADNHDLLGAVDELLEVGVVAELLGSGSDLRLHVLDDAGGFSGAVVFGAELAPAEDFQGGVALDLEPVAGVLSGLGTVNLGQMDWRVIVQQVLGGLFEFRLQFLTMAAPANG